LADYRLKVDHFEGCHALDEKAEKIEGAPNFRQVAGFPVFGCAQPTEEGFGRVLEKVPRGTPEKPIKTVWYNMRLEPVVYINGMPHAPRHPDRMHEDLDIEASVDELNGLEEKFANIVKERVAANPELKISRDAAYMENPMERGAGEPGRHGACRECEKFCRGDGGSQLAVSASASCGRDLPYRGLL